jgi:hypothetical protein
VGNAVAAIAFFHPLALLDAHWRGGPIYGRLFTTATAVGELMPPPL